MVYNHKNYEKAACLIIAHLLKIIKLDVQQLKKCCAIVDYYIRQKHLFLGECKFIDSEQGLR